MMNDNIGIDFSKAHLDVHRLSDHGSTQVANTPAGFRGLRRWLGSKPIARVIYEATGPYHRAFEEEMRDRLPLVKVNPLQARRFAQAQGTRAKTDKADARMLARMGAAFEFNPDTPAAQDHHQLKELQIARLALIKDRTRLNNRLQTQTLAFTRRQTKARLDQIRRQLKKIDAEIETRIKDCPKRARAHQILQSIPGLGATTAGAILVEMPEVGTLSNKAVASIAGLAPITRQSGQWKGKASIQGGRKFLRDALYMPALVAMKHNHDMKQKYNQLKDQGKPSKVAITAIMRKLIILANTLVRDDRQWSKNAP